MTTRGNGSITMPPALLAEVQAAAQEEHRPPEDLVCDAVLLYLQTRHAPNIVPGKTLRKNLAELLMESPFAGAQLDLERRKDIARPVDL
jgi:hypothetical protein